MSVSILVVDDEPDVTDLFRQRFRREAREGTYVMHFAGSGITVAVAEVGPGGSETTQAGTRQISLADDQASFPGWDPSVTDRWPLSQRHPPSG